MSNPPPKIYVKTGCPWCREALDFLKQHKIPVQEINVTTSRDAFDEMVALSGQSKAPTLDWHGEILADFGVDELRPFLKQRGVLP
jgi:glutaredoxin